MPTADVDVPHVPVTDGTCIALADLDGYTTSGVLLSVTPARKHAANPVLPLGDVHEWDALQARPWQSRTVLFDPADRLFKCWYDGTDLSTERWWATGYAESEDGITWHKPRLGLFEYHGSSDNNICLFGWGPVMLDCDEQDPQRRFKMIVSTKRFTCSVRGASREPAVRLAYSADGKRWQEGAALALPDWHGERPDVVALVQDHHDPDPERRIKLIWQSKVAAAKPGPSPVRAKHLAWAPTLEQLGTAKSYPLLSPNDGAEHEIHFAMLAAIPGAWFVGYEYGVYVPDGTGVHGRFVSDVRLAASTPQRFPHFTRVYPDQQLLIRGDRGSWDDGLLVISDKPVTVGDTTYLYYAGCGEEWTSWMGANQSPSYRWQSTGTVRVSRMGVATLPRDGYTHLHTVDGLTPGWAVTPAYQLDGKLSLWATVTGTQQHRSWVEVEVLPENGRATGGGETAVRAKQASEITGRSVPAPLPDAVSTNGIPIVSDGVQRSVQRRDARLSTLSGQPIRLRWRLYGAARLHAFGFTAARRVVPCANA